MTGILIMKLCAQQNLWVPHDSITNQRAAIIKQLLMHLYYLLIIRFVNKHTEAAGKLMLS